MIEWKVLYEGHCVIRRVKFAGASEAGGARDQSQYDLDLKIAGYNFGAPLTNDEWCEIEHDLQASDVVFAIHVMDGENAARLLTALENHKTRHRAVIVINCMPDLMRRTRMGRLDLAKLMGGRSERERGKA